MDNFMRNLNKLKDSLFSSYDVCFDIGTTNTRIAIRTKGVVLREASCLGINLSTKEYIFFGDEAKLIIGKTPHFIKIIKPIVTGVVSDFDAEVALILKFFNKSVDPYFHSYRLIRPSLHAIAAVPYIATEIEKKAIEEVMYKAGFQTVSLIEGSLASSIGAHIDVFTHKPHLIVNLGGGLVQLAIISGGGIVSEKTLKIAGDHMNHVIANYAYLKHGIILGEGTCDGLKNNLLDFSESQNQTTMVRGKSLENGLPKSIRIRSSDIKEALINNFLQINDAIKELIEGSAPEVVDEIYENGIMLAGGLARIRNIGSFFEQELSLKISIAENPDDTTINGLLSISKNEKYLKDLTIPKI